MQRFKGCNEVIYDANIIIYYCFLDGKIRIMGLTNLSRKLTFSLINSGIKVLSPDFIIKEIKIKTIAKIVSEYLDNKHNIKRLVGIYSEPRPSLKLKIKDKIEKNFSDLLNKRWFVVESYSPNEQDLYSIKKFFESNRDSEKMKTLLEKKQRTSPCPSNEDLSLILYSKDKSASIVSNDFDITCFSNELIEEGLSYDIVSLMDIKRH